MAIPIRARHAWLFTIVLGVVAFGFGATPVPTEALGRWLPKIAANFVAWGQPNVRYGGRFDSFRCGGSTAKKSTVRDFDYPESTCSVLRHGTTLFFGSGEPQRGRLVYDTAHRIVLYSVGCCAARTYLLAANVPPPPAPVRSADLSLVRTARGAALGMTRDGLQAIYGKSDPYVAGRGAAALRVISYTTFRSNPVRSNGGGCGQYQSFAMKNDRVSAIEIYVGC
jgi:hypothetical protein